MSVNQIIDSYKLFWKNFSNFSGRSRRRDYWSFALINAIITSVLGFLGQHVGVFQIVLAVYNLAVLIPGFAITIRRLHDTGRSAWWLLLCLTGIGSIVILIFTCLDSQPHDNQYGPNPKAWEANPMQ